MRLLPNAGNWENGETAPLLTLPLMRRPSAARWLRSSCRGLGLRCFELGGHSDLSFDPIERKKFQLPSCRGPISGKGEVLLKGSKAQHFDLNGPAAIQEIGERVEPVHIRGG